MDNSMEKREEGQERVPSNVTIARKSNRMWHTACAQPVTIDGVTMPADPENWAVKLFAMSAKKNEHIIQAAAVKPA